MDGPRLRVLYVSGRDAAPPRDPSDGADVVLVEEGIDPSAAGRVDCVVCEVDAAADEPDLLRTVRDSYPNSPVLLAPEGNGDRWRSLLEGLPAAGRRGGARRMPIGELGLAEELRLKERAMDEAPVGITITDPDREDNPLIYVNDSFERMTGYPKDEVVGRNCRMLQGPESDPEAVAEMRRAIEEERPVSVELVNYRKDGERFWNRVDIAPIRDADGEVTNFVGFQMDVTERKEAEFTVREERTNLEHLLDRINGLIQDVTQGLVQSVGRREVERRVCERLAADDAYAFAWIGEPDLGRDRITANECAGQWDVTPDELTIELGDDPTDPVARAVETREPRVVDGDDLADVAGSQPWIDGRSVDGLAAIPLVYKDTSYGVLVVYAVRPGALNARESVVLEALGRAIATAFNALESRRILTTDNVVELELEIRDRDLFLVDLSSRANCRLDYKGSVPRPDGSLLTFFTADADPRTVSDLVEDAPEVGEVSLVRAGDEESLFEFRVSASSIVAALAERGVKTRDIAVSDGVARLQVELPGDADARSIVELVEERYPETALVSYHERERPPKTRAEFIDDLEDRLTDRQLTALHKAYISGFYDWNRSVSGDELAESMDISRSTFHQHLRAAERKLIAEFFER